VITKGEVSVNVLWLPQEEGAGPVASGFVFPVSQIMDFAGADEGCVCDARYRLVSVAAVITEDGRSFEVEAPVLAFVRLQRPSEVMLAEDAYSTRYKCDAAGKQFSALEVLAPVSEIMAVDEETDMPEGAISICDCWAEAAPVPELEKDGAVSCRARVCILAKNSEGSMEYFEKSFAAKSPSLFVPLEEQLFADVSASSDSAECSLSDGGRARIRFKIYADGCIYRLKKWPVLTDVSVDEEHPVGTCAPAMTLYYADPGEKVWDIAKRYGSTPSAVAQENAIEGDAVEDRRMLMIPAVI